MSNISVYAKTKFILKMIDNIKKIITKHSGIVKALEDELEAQPAILMALLQIGESLNKIDKEVIKKYATTKSIFGVCLGLQAIGEVFGGTLTNLEKVYHGVATKVTKTEDDFIFNNLPNEFEVGRYHSWVVSNENLPAQLIVTSTDKNGQIMSMKHAHFDIRGVQYHPESVLTPYGKKILENWLSH